MIFSLKKYESCRGLSIGPFGRYLIEIWYCPRNYQIKEHTHPNQDIKLIPLFCNHVRFHRRKKGEYLGQTVWATFRYIGRIFTINAGDAHHFSVSSWPLIFMNIEKWYIKPTSASEDLEVTNAT